MTIKEERVWLTKKGWIKKIEDREGFTKEGIKNISDKEWIKWDKENMENETKEVR